jgi:hypothetical protein
MKRAVRRVVSLRVCGVLRWLDRGQGHRWLTQYAAADAGS